eukprot:474653_1
MGWHIRVFSFETGREMFYHSPTGGKQTVATLIKKVAKEQGIAQNRVLLTTETGLTLKPNEPINDWTFTDLYFIQLNNNGIVEMNKNTWVISIKNSNIKLFIKMPQNFNQNFVIAHLKKQISKQYKIPINVQVIMDKNAKKLDDYVQLIVYENEASTLSLNIELKEKDDILLYTFFRNVNKKKDQSIVNKFILLKKHDKLNKIETLNFSIKNEIFDNNYFKQHLNIGLTLLFWNETYKKYIRGIIIVINGDEYHKKTSIKIKWIEEDLDYGWSDTITINDSQYYNMIDIDYFENKFGPGNNNEIKDNNDIEIKDNNEYNDLLFEIKDKNTKQFITLNRNKTIKDLG